ncbi:Cro/C1-type HTH domain protein [Acididesulfobacillus acetoxydans]|uniref:Cro/C1-type HTH domain protein n=1 Tax=Acididesulfobacillus acetoxydans TaxID=1561005 RepID=A0A8S0WNQ0_9FIRM|nr:tetratricopeptide repeat protein [Acididesulfobacillus acetoxydans]CAA7601434.1 Cro/C1-type HTH domain protein [Acididesulfobacillus acetoxydans]CEJ08865.1 Helix-turn-helix domain protein [Acididesulfobacillus acetoxydans]
MSNLLGDYLAGKGLSQAEIARRAGVSKSYLSMIAHGQRRSLNPLIVERLARELGLAPPELKSLLGHGSETQPARSGVYPGTGNDGPGQSGLALFYQALEQGLRAEHANNRNELERVCRVIAGMDQGLVPLRRNFLCWHEALELAWQNRFEQSLAVLRAAVGFKPTSPLERRFKAKIIGDIGAVLVARGCYKEALKSLRLSLILWDEGEQGAVVNLNLGTLFRRTDNFADAVEAYEKAVLMGSPSLKLLAYAGLGQVSLDQGGLGQARKYLLKGYALSRSLKDAPQRADILCNLGKYYKEAGKQSRAVYLLSKGLEIASVDGNTRTKLYLLAELADIYLVNGRLKQADRILARIEEDAAADGGDVLLAGLCLTALAKKGLCLGQIQQSLLVLNRCYRALSKFAPTAEFETCCDLLRQAHVRLRKPQEAAFFAGEVRRARKALKRRT